MNYELANSPSEPGFEVHAVSRVQIALRRALFGLAAFSCLYGVAETAHPGELSDMPAAVASASEAVPPSEVSVPTVSPVEEREPAEAARFVVYPVTIAAAGFSPVTKTNKELVDTTRAGWLDLANASSGALSTEVEVTVRPAQKVAIDGLKKVADFCKGKVENFRQKLMDAVVPKKGGPEVAGIPMIVINQTGRECFTADAGVNIGMVFYDQNYFTPYGTQHEIGHTQGFGHGDALGSGKGRRIGCATPSEVIGPNCYSLAYGDPYTTMGGYRFNLGDPDPINGVSLKRLGAITPKEVLRVGVGERVCKLKPLADQSGRGARLAHVVIDPTEITILNKDKTKSTDTVTSVYFEISSSYTDANKSKELSLKVFATNDEAQDEGLPATYLIPIKGKQVFGKNEIGKNFTFEIGGRKVSFTLQSLPSVKDAIDSAQVRIKIVKTDPDMPYGRSRLFL